MAAKEPYYHTWPVGRLCFITKRKLRRKPTPQAPDKPGIGAPVHSPPNAPPSPTDGDLHYRQPSVNQHMGPNVPRKPVAHEGPLDTLHGEQRPKPPPPQSHKLEASPLSTRPDASLEGPLNPSRLAQPVPVQDRRQRRPDADDGVAEPLAGKDLSLEELTALTGRPYYGHDTSSRRQ
jgi:hypothetical protein